jgi:hypothetical protein
MKTNSVNRIRNLVMLNPSNANFFVVGNLKKKKI